MKKGVCKTIDTRDLIRSTDYHKSIYDISKGDTLNA